VEEMKNSKSNRPLEIGLLIFALSWFSFTFYNYAVASLEHKEGFIMVTDLPGALGLGFRSAGGFIAVITILFYIAKRNLSSSEAVMSLRWIILFEAVYFVSLLPSGLVGLWALISRQTLFSSISFLINSTIPCLVEGIPLPIVLAKLFFELNPKKSAKGPIKWGLISGTFYLFVFWLNNTGMWITAVMQKGTAYVTLYPVNLLSFVMTTIGLLLLTLFAAYFSKGSFGAETLTRLNFRRIGGIITAFGLYFDVIYMLYIFFGSVGGWSSWYAWFLNHNMDLWVMSLPLIGLPLLFRRQE
jgi:hypothetical protein